MSADEATVPEVGEDIYVAPDNTESPEDGEGEE